MSPTRSRLNSRLQSQKQLLIRQAAVIIVVQASVAAGAMETAAVSGCRMAVTSATEESAMALKEAQGQPM